MGKMDLININKIYPNGVQAVFDFSMEIKDGEFVVLVGPSGCGKSTTLRMIAGLEEISSGTLSIDDRIINDQAPKDRDIAMVFQNYALYSHMTVYHNMAFSMVLRKENSNLIHERVMWAAEILGLKPYLYRRPQYLSGGQRQRVALGRAIVRNPKVFLLDEPLSNLDAKLRTSMRKELKYLHNRLGTTMIYVTHDQIEAMTLADRIVIMKDGYVQQIGTPYEVYNHPINLYVASFIGTPPMNFFEARISKEGQLEAFGSLIDISKHPQYQSLKERYKQDKIKVGIRPPYVRVEKGINQNKGLVSKVQIFELLGADALVYFQMDNVNLIASFQANEILHIGDPINITFDIEHLYFFDLKTEQCIYE
jgi:multiple sugar transport system ATP-binding protein